MHRRRAGHCHAARKSGRSSLMLTNRRTVRIQFVDCDPHGIVFYPRYFEFFDACTDALFERAGLPRMKMLRTYHIDGIPLMSEPVSGGPHATAIPLSSNPALPNADAAAFPYATSFITERCWPSRASKNGCGSYPPSALHPDSKAKPFRRRS